MATIEKRKNSKGKISYRARIRLSGQSWHSKTFKRKTDADNWAKAIESDIARGYYVPTVEAEKRTINELVDRYVKEILPSKDKNKDYKKVARLLEWWKRNIGRYSVLKVTPAIISECRQKLSTEVIKVDKSSGEEIELTRSNATVNRYLAAMSHAFNVAVKEWLWLQDSPMRNLRRFSESSGLVRFLSDEERERLLKACKEHKNEYIYLVVVIAISTGARQGEIMSLTWDQVDFKRRRIVLDKTKNNEIRVLPISDFLLDLLKKHSKIRKIDSKLLFQGAKKGSPVFIRPIWYEVVKAAEIKDFRFHDLRHTAASYLAMNGATLTELAAILGHKTLAMVKRYSHLTEQHTANIVNKMNQNIFG